VTNKFKVRVVSPWFGDFETNESIFSSAFKSDEADALLCEWAPSDELFTFPRRKGWYCCEPICQFRELGGGNWPRFRDQLDAHEFLNHNHPNPTYRVPHVTHFQRLEVNSNLERIDRAIAIVSNHGGSPWRSHPHIRYRNCFITHPKVDLFGRSGWNHYRSKWYSKRCAPGNYRGEIPGDWPADGKRDLMARYKVAICLENMNEPYYFTEKFVEAVCAGCIPVYRAHPTIRDAILKGARWIDPTEYHDDPDLTLSAALKADADIFSESNREWLQNGNLASTSHTSVYARLETILREH
jgi:hypothetical protein